MVYNEYTERETGKWGDKGGERKWDGEKPYKIK